MVHPIRIFIVDDQALIRDGLCSLLSVQPDMTVVGNAANGAEALAQMESTYGSAQQPDVMLLDIRMPVMDGIATTQALRERWPDIRILILTTFDDDADVSKAIRSGAQGYLLKDTSSQGLAMAIRAIHQGCSYFGPGLMEKALATVPLKTAAISPDPSLTPREQEILQLIGSGSNNREIAASLFISERTVKNHVTNILSRLGLRDRTQAAIYAQKQF
jgi:DNA-binding NarL/FixJ family response regulator